MLQCFKAISWSWINIISGYITSHKLQYTLVDIAHVLGLMEYYILAEQVHGPGMECSVVIVEHTDLDWVEQRNLEGLGSSMEHPIEQ
jgi:hypothetical protein